MKIGLRRKLAGESNSTIIACTMRMAGHERETAKKMTKKEECYDAEHPESSVKRQPQKRTLMMKQQDHQISRGQQTGPKKPPPPPQSLTGLSFRRTLMTNQQDHQLWTKPPPPQQSLPGLSDRSEKASFSS